MSSALRSMKNASRRVARCHTGIGVAFAVSLYLALPFAPIVSHSSCVVCIEKATFVTRQQPKCVSQTEPYGFRQKTSNKFYSSFVLFQQMWIFVFGSASSFRASVHTLHVLNDMKFEEKKKPLSTAFSIRIDNRQSWNENREWALQTRQAATQFTMRWCWLIVFATPHWIQRWCALAKRYRAYAIWLSSLYWNCHR